MEDVAINPLKVLIITIDEPYFITKTIYPLINIYKLNIIGIGVMKSIVGKNKSLISFGLELLNSFGLRGSIQHIAFYLKCYIHDFFTLFNIKIPFNLKYIAKNKNIPYFKIKNINSRLTITKIKKLEPDVILSVAATQIFKKEIISISKIATINIHSALLPKYRGASPNFWNLLNGEKISGVSVHFISEKIDSGKLISQEKMNIEKDETLFTLNTKTSKISPKLIRNSVNKLKNKNFQGRILNLENGSFFSLPKRKDMKLFKKRGKNFY